MMFMSRGGICCQSTHASALIGRQNLPWGGHS